MKKIQELLFLQNLQGVKKSTIYKKYWDCLCNSNNVNELIDLIKTEFNEHSDLEYSNALRKSEMIFDDLSKQPDIRIITVFDDNYPKRLNVMKSNRPLVIYARGNYSLLGQSNMAIVGTRNPSTYVEKLERDIINKIFDISNKVIVSGLALGCDGIAHETVLRAKKETLAVLPSGINIITPPSHTKLAEDIISNNGCIISEYGINIKAEKNMYIERDKVMAALSDSTLVVECDIKSGTMHTVDAAKMYKRKILCLYPKDKNHEVFQGNKFIIDKKGGIEIKDFSMLKPFLTSEYNMQNYEYTVMDYLKI